MGNIIFTNDDYWRAVILYGLNTATYKIALAQCLISFSEQGLTKVTMPQMAEAFFDIYLKRLENGKPQLLLPDRMTVMERVVMQFNTGSFSRKQAIDEVERAAFGDVIPRFHTVNDSPLPVKFYDYTKNGLVLTDNLYEAVSGGGKETLKAELGSRWDLLEAAFEMHREESELINDIRQFYLSKGYARTDITHTRPVLNGYQNGVCFYCGELMAGDDVHVDHVIPRQLLYHDEIWNLVLAHNFCNLQKSDSLPGPAYIQKLIDRNEHFIASNHPIKKRLIQQMGKTHIERNRFVWKTYEDAKTVIRYTWEGIKGYNPQTDPFYKTFVRSLCR